jgi:hypothetical protein
MTGPRVVLKQCKSDRELRAPKAYFLLHILPDGLCEKIRLVITQENRPCTR